MKYLIVGAMLMAGCAGAFAQSEGNGLYLEGFGETTEQSQQVATEQTEAEMEKPTQAELEKQAANSVGKNGEAQWYVAMDYAGFEFELPAGLQVQKGSSLIGKSADGTFGVSMSNVEKQGSDQKMAFELCRRLATSMHLPNPKVEKVNYGKCGGAKATGVLEGQQVTVLVLPYRGQEVTTVILASPNREEWVNHFLQTLKR